MKPKSVLILIGSDSDLSTMEEATLALKRFQISYEIHIASAHRTPQKVKQLVQPAQERGFGVIIAGAGMSAHLAGFAAAHSTLPVIGVPLASGMLAGIDALLSTVQMPKGMPVATLGIGLAGAYNAGLLATQILAIQDNKLQKMLEAYREELSQKVEQKDSELQSKT